MIRAVLMHCRRWRKSRQALQLVPPEAYRRLRLPPLRRWFRLSVSLEVDFHHHRRRRPQELSPLQGRRRHQPQTCLQSSNN